MSDEGEKKKLIIDEDWKAQAQKEKEQVQHEATEPEQQGEMPPASFEGLVSMLATQAFYALGLVRPEDSEEEIEPDWAMAKFNIDLLAMLQDKCKGNLSNEEQQMLDGTVGQLRMLFVNLSKG